jgi:hypothetical protein
MMEEVNKLTDNNECQLLKCSPVHRLHNMYKYYISVRVFSSKADKPTFFEFLIYLIDDNGWDTLYTYGSQYSNDPTNMAENDLHNLYGSGKNAFCNDFTWVHKFFKELGKNTTIYNRSIVLGATFYSRGIHYRNDEIINSIDCSRTLKLPNQTSCWCRVFCPSDIDKDSQYDNKSLLGQLNGFFVLDFPHEPLLHGIPMASINLWKGSKPKLGTDNFQQLNSKKTTRSNYYYESLTQIDFKQKNNEKIDNVGFVPLYNIYPCPLAILALDWDQNPVVLNDRRIKKNCVDDDGDIKLLLFFPLARNMECFLKSDNLRQTFHPYYRPERLDVIKDQVKNKL